MWLCTKFEQLKFNGPSWATSAYMPELLTADIKRLTSSLLEKVGKVCNIWGLAVECPSQCGCARNCSCPWSSGFVCCLEVFPETKTIGERQREDEACRRKTKTVEGRRRLSEEDEDCRRKTKIAWLLHADSSVDSPGSRPTLHSVSSETV